MEDLGARIREARQDKGWTLTTLAERCGLSSSFLSQVERGLTTLSIVSLSAICQALGLPIASLFESSGSLEERGATVTAADQQLHIRIGSSPVSYRYLTRQLPAAPVEELLIAEFPAGCRQPDSIHKGEEFGYVLAGQLILQVNGQTHALRSGDSYRVAPAELHSYAADPSSGARILMAITQRFIEVEPVPVTGPRPPARDLPESGSSEEEET